MPPTDDKEKDKELNNAQQSGGVIEAAPGAAGPVETSKGAKTEITYVGSANSYTDPDSGIRLAQGVKSLVTKEVADRLYAASGKDFYPPRVDK